VLLSSFPHCIPHRQVLYDLCSKTDIEKDRTYDEIYVKKICVKYTCMDFCTIVFLCSTMQKQQTARELRYRDCMMGSTNDSLLKCEHLLRLAADCQKLNDVRP